MTSKFNMGRAFAFPSTLPALSFIACLIVMVCPFAVLYLDPSSLDLPFSEYFSEIFMFICGIVLVIIAVFCSPYVNLKKKGGN